MSAENINPKHEYQDWKSPDTTDEVGTESNVADNSIEKKKNLALLEKFTNTRVGRTVRKVTLYSLLTLAAAGAFEAVHKVVRYKQEVEDTMKEEPQDPKEREAHRQNVAYINEYFGTDEVIKDIAEREVANKREKNDSPPPEITVDPKTGLDSRVVRSLCDESTYPEGWINGEVKSIKILAGGQEKDYFGKKIKTEGVHAADVGSGQSSIEIMDLADYSKEERYIMLNSLFGHELSHVNDFRNKKDAFFYQRITLLANLIKEIESDGLAEKMEKNVEQISNPTERKEVVAIETFAEAGQLYFTAPEILKDAYPGLYEIFDAWVNLSDGNFDPIATKEARNEIIEQTK